MNRLFIVIGFAAVCNAASLNVIPAGRTIYQSVVPSVSVVPSIVRSAVDPLVPRAVEPLVRSLATAVVSDVVRVAVSHVELADWEAYKVRPK